MLVGAHVSVRLFDLCKRHGQIDRHANAASFDEISEIGPLGIELQRAGC